jgi:hypothetical protein
MSDPHSVRDMERGIRYLPVIGTLAFFALFVSYYLIFGLEHATPISGASLLIVRGRLLYGMSAILLTAALIWNLLLAVSVTRRYGFPRFSISAAASVIVLAVIGIVLEFLVSYLGRVDLAGATAGAIIDCIATHDGTNRVSVITMVLNICAFVDVVAVMVAATSLSSRAIGADEPQLADMTRSFTYLAYSGAALLAIGILEVFILYSWSAAFPCETDPGALRSFGDAVAMDFGFLYSLLMAIIYLPPAVVLNEELFHHYGKQARATGALTLGEWLNALGLRRLPLSVFGSYAPIVIPLATGILAKSLDVLG